MTKLVNRAKMTTSSTGTGSPITLGSAVDGYQTFAAAGVANGDVVRYVIEDGGAWEIGTGTYTASGTTLTRTVSESSNADAALNLTGSAVVYVSAAAEDIPPALELYAENPSSPTAPSATGTNAVAIGSGAIASQLNAVSLGNLSTASGGSSTALGVSTTASSSFSLAVGWASSASSTASAALGPSAIAVTGTNATALTNSRASGTSSLAAAIANNTSSYGATGANSIAIGDRAKATGSRAFAIGYSSIASGSGAKAFGGFGSGTGTLASKEGSTAIGDGAKSEVSYKVAISTRSFAAQGDAQTGITTLRAQTTNTTPIALYSDTNLPDTGNQVILPNNSAYAFHGTIIARQQASAGSDYASWEIKGALLRDGSAATTVLGNGIVNKLYATAGASAWAVALTADTTNGGLAITVTGAAATNIRWVATVNTSEVTY